MSLVWSKRNAVFIVLGLPHTRTQKIRSWACAFYTPFEKLHTEERFIHFKMPSVYNVKPACVLLAYNIALAKAA